MPLFGLYPSRGRRWLLAAAKVAVIALVVWFVWETLTAGIEDLSAEWARGTWRLDVGWLVAAAGLYLAGTFPCGLFWHRTLVAMGQRPRLAETLRAYYIGHLGKYVPGKGMVLVLRTGLVPRQPGSAVAVGVTVFYETMTMMAVAAAWGAATLILLPVAGEENGLWLAAAAGMALAIIALPTLPPVFQWLLRQVRVGRGDPQAADRIRRLDYRMLGIGWACMAAAWAITGLGMWATLRAIGQDQVDPFLDLPRVTAAVALATVAGFLSFIPAGLFVRDSALAELLVLLVGLDPAPALVGAILVRLTGIVAELVISGILYACSPPSSRSTTKPRA
jgi:uncharacterized membrane protein YbhN (UPF0104 family)